MATGTEDTGNSGHVGDSHSSGINDERVSISANFDPCVYSSIYRWQFQNSSCSQTFFNSLEPLNGNTVYVIEYVHALGSDEVQYELLAVGGYIGRRGESSVSYTPFKSSHIELPERDFVICVLWNPPWLSWEYDPITREPFSSSYTGYLYDMLIELSKSMGFQYIIHNGSAVEFTEGYNHSLEETEARMDELFNQDVCDLFLAALEIHGGRLQSDDGIGLSKGFQEPKMYLLTKRIERNENVSIWQFLTPFKEESWVILYASLLLVSLLMTYVNKKNPNEFRRAARELREGAEHWEHLGIMNSLWFNYAVLVGQGSQILPKSFSLKVMTGTWWFFVLLVISAYTANMISFMTQTDNEGITTVEELVSQQEFQYGMVVTNAMLTKLLPQARNAPYTTMWVQIKDSYDRNVFSTINDALERVFQEQFILIATYQETVQAVMQSCDYDKVGDGFYQYQYGLPIPRGWQFTSMLNDHLSKLYDYGILSELEEKWFADIESRCEKKEETTVAGQLDLKAFIGMYVFLSLGVTAGIIVCIFETMYVKYGGLGGMLGRAKKYEFRRDNIEHQRPDKLMEKEFENWPGGWEVIKHRPFVNTISLMMDEKAGSKHSATKTEDRPTSSARLYPALKRSTNNNDTCCPGCGREINDGVDII